ncbi:MAG: 16S rRNA (adenine(1518)-N(6)/adenine(1519)-N(6))-dimethyltransferase RsmA [Oscillospiraceae bacterium]|nr:16S rRNA (adenine(1518)-N(6)/adenine(1519)-N(6))-dimethyltransferase RsmA [Oscillospiraceae bacterium]
MEKLTNLSNIKNIMRSHNFNFVKSLGQNFLINPSVCPRIAAAGLNSKADSKPQPQIAGVIEIGAGIGVLTRELAKNADKVAAIELDRRLIPVLRETLADFDNVKLIEGDILKLDIKGIIDSEFNGGPAAVCANLPYYITTPVIAMFLEQRLNITSMTVMTQKEAALRITAAPGTRESGAISYMIRYYSIPKLLFNVAAGSFYPAPKVESAVIKLDIKKNLPLQDTEEKFLFRCIRAGFSQRRKTLSNALSAGLNIPKNQIIAAIQECKIPTTSRAEQLTLDDFILLSERILSFV